MTSGDVAPRRWEAGKLFARVLCAVLAAIGVVPLVLTLLVSSDPVKRWAERETSRILRDELGVSASYRVEVKLLPLRLAVLDLAVPASDGGSPALVAESVTVSPRVFALLGGRFDLGAIELNRPRARLVVTDGKLTNLRYRLREQSASTPKGDRAPFSSLSISEGRFAVVLDGTRIDTGPIDLDVFAERGPSFEIALQADESRVTRRRIDQTLLAATTGKEVHDDDVVCRLEVRARIEPEAFDVRRLSLFAELDGRPEPGSARPCRPEPDDARELSVSVSQLHGVRRAQGMPLYRGHVNVRAPLALVNRFAKTLELHGFLSLSGDVRYDGTSKLPEFDGKLDGKGLGLGGYRLAQKLSVDTHLTRDAIVLPRYEMGFSDGQIVLTGVRIEPLKPGVPLSVESMDGLNVPFTSLMRDLDVTPRTIVSWDMRETHAKKIKGTLVPLHIEGDLAAETRDFEVFDRAWNDPQRKHMIGVKRASIRGRFRVVPDALEFVDTRAEFGQSTLLAKLVSIGFQNRIALSISKGSKLHLADVSPLVDIPMVGNAELDIEMGGLMNDPVLTGNVAIRGFEFGGFPIGDLKSGKVRFRPLVLDLADVEAQRGASSWTVPSARIDFGSAATLVADAKMKSKHFDMRDFFAIWRFDQDPRWSDIAGEMTADASVRYVLGGAGDPCGKGVLSTNGKLAFKRLDLFGEHYDGGDVDFRFRWFDRDASYHAIELAAPNVLLRKGSGSILGSVNVRSGAKIEGNLVATDVPIGKIDALPSILRAADGKASAAVEVSGTLDAIKANATARLSQVRLGRSVLPPSRLAIDLTPVPADVRVVGRSKCGGPITPPFDLAEHEADRSQGVFTVNGSLFDRQVVLDGLTVTRNRNKLVRGKVTFNEVDLGAVAELSPTFALSDSRLDGRMSGTLDIAELRTLDPAAAKARLAFSALSITRGGLGAKLLPNAQAIDVADSAVRVPGLSLVATTTQGQATVDLSGGITRLRDAPEIAGTLALRPMELAALTQMVPRVERAKGTLTGRVSVSGPLASPTYGGGVELTGGELVLRDLPTPVSDIEVVAKLSAGELTIARGSARMGNGKLSVTGGAPLRGFELGAARFEITARDLSLPLGEDIRTTADADLLATWRPTPTGERSLPRLTGNVSFRSFEYRRPVTMTAELQSLGHRGKRTHVEVYDPSEDVVELDLTLRSARPLLIRNELVEADLVLANEGLVLTGTNGRFGMRGTVDIKRGGRITLRRNVFEITQGTVRFDDGTRIAPSVDVTATSEYRRYSDSSTSAGTGTSTAPAPSGGTSSSVSGGRWTIRMHAHGDADDLKIDLTSEPALAQDDIFLLITVGLTRAELDQAKSASVGESVALEALGTLSGADRAVTEAVPVIDEFRFGSAYSSRTGRTEPTVTVGKRLTERVRANVTTGLAESREVRSNVEWRLNNRVSVESSYDNVNDISSSALGNLGADIRWRLEFE
jgi:translocation and assembly module TamB